MSYIGQNLPSNSFVGYTTDTFAGDGSTTAFTMSKAPFNESAVIVVINNVVQQPTEDFTVSGTTLTIDAAVASGDVIYATHTGGALPIDQASSLTSNIAITTTGASNFNGGVTMGGTTPTLTIGDAGAEDTKIVFDGNAQDFHIGLDDSADSLTIGLGSALGTTSHMVIDSAGAVTKPLQPAFLVTKSGAQSNVSNGNTITWDSEVYDQNADFASNTFTAPVTGRYLFAYQIRIDALASNMTYALFNTQTSNRTYQNIYNTQTGADVSVIFRNFTGSIVADMDANDTCIISYGESGGSVGTADVDGTLSFWSGTLLC